MGYFTILGYYYSIISPIKFCLSSFDFLNDESFVSALYNIGGSYID